MKMAKASSSTSPKHSDLDELGNGGDLDNLNVCVQDRYLPIANISKIMKKALPVPKIAKDAKGKSTSLGPKIAKEAKDTIQESVSKFISFITLEAAQIFKNEKWKTINDKDLLWAMKNLGLDNYEKVLTIYLHRYRESKSGLMGCGLNKLGDQASEKKEEGRPSMTSGVQMCHDGAYQLAVALLVLAVVLRLSQLLALVQAETLSPPSEITFYLFLNLMSTNNFVTAFSGLPASTPLGFGAITSLSFKLWLACSTNALVVGQFVGLFITLNGTSLYFDGAFGIDTSSYVGTIAVQYKGAFLTNGEGTITGGSGNF